MITVDLAEVLRLHREWLYGTGGSRADLHGADLRGANLRGANLRGADLRWADLYGADLPSRWIYASVGWSGHGECGRALLAVQSPQGISLSCGCFSGSPSDLRDYISRGEERYRPSRSLALDLVLMLLAECPEVAS